MLRKERGCTDVDEKEVLPIRIKSSFFQFIIISATSCEEVTRWKRKRRKSRRPAAAKQERPFFLSLYYSPPEGEPYRKWPIVYIVVMAPTPAAK